MKTKYSVSAGIIALAIFSSCSNSDEVNPNSSLTDEMISVVGNIEEKKPEVAAVKSIDGEVIDGITRTSFSGDFTQIAASRSTVKFSWTAGDKVYLENGESSEANLTGSDTQKSYATFKFKKASLAQTSTPVQYVGTKSTKYGEAIIQSEQIQTQPNNAEHIAQSGDCATAEITKNTKNNYTFTLKHKASYLCFMPKSTKYTKLYSITISAQKPISGSYKLESSKLEDATELTDTHKGYVYLKTGTGGVGFDITKDLKQTQNASYAVIHPQTTALVCVFTVLDGSTNKVMNVVKYIKSQAFEANKVHSFSVNLDNDYGRWYDHLYYMWDAQVGKDYWYGHESEQSVNLGQTGTNYPTVNTDPRWCSTGNTDGTRSAKTCMGKSGTNNNALYYVYNDFSFDTKIYWPMKGVLQHGGAWITRYSKCKWEKYPAIKTKTNTAWYTLQRYDAKTGTPTENIENYFFLPASGNYRDGQLQNIGTSGNFWMQNRNDNSNIDGFKERAYFLSFRLDDDKGSYMIVGQNERRTTGLMLLHNDYGKY